MPGKLAATRLLAMIEQIGQHHHVGLLRQVAHGVDRARDRRLAVHFGIEEQVEQAPDLILSDRFAAIGTAQRLPEIMAIHRKDDAVPFQ